MTPVLPHIVIQTISPDGISRLALTIFFMPIITFFVLFFAGKHIPAFIRSWLATIVMGVMFVLSLCMHIVSEGDHLSVWNWFHIGSIQFTTSMLITSYSTTMMIIATFVSFMVHLYSIQYMKERRNHSKYFPYLALFVSSMLGIVLSDNLLITFIFWELVGLSSFLLIGFWYEKDAAAEAAKKAFMFNKFADLAFVIAIMMLYAIYGTTELSVIKSQTNISGILHTSIFALPVFAGFAIWFATVGKSAQFPLYVWLPDAMAGPTPVSALLHAATMVAAGVYLLLKTSFLLGGWVSNCIVIVGCLTALLAALQAIRTFDSKKVLAFSTVSQLGFMMMAVGVGAYDAAFFHLATHAFFKACLFLSVGAVIHSMHHIQQHSFSHGHYKPFDTLDMRLMGGFRKKMPLTFAAYVVSYAALIGLPLFSGFLSKDAILISLYNQASMDGSWRWLVVIASLTTVFISAFYMSRQLFLIFFGEFRLGKTGEIYNKLFSEIRESDWLINIPLILLGVMSFWIFFSINPLHAQTGWWMKESFILTHIHNTEWFIPLTAFFCTTIAFLLARSIYFNQPNILERRNDLLTVLSEHNYYIEKGIDKIFIQPTMKLSAGIHTMDTCIDKLIHLKVYFFIALAQTANVLDIYIVDGSVHIVARVSRFIGSYFRSYLKGEVQSYFYFTLFAFILILVWLLWYQTAA